MTPLERIEKLTAIAKEAIDNDDSAMFASDDDKLIFQHHFINGYEKGVNAVLQEAIERIESLLRDARDTNGESQKISNAVGILNSLKIPE